jgi:hypothetical protein
MSGPLYIVASYVVKGSLICNEKVASSNLATGTNRFKYLHICSHASLKLFRGCVGTVSARDPMMRAKASAGPPDPFSCSQVKLMRLASELRSAVAALRASRMRDRRRELGHCGLEPHGRSRWALGAEMWRTLNPTPQ